MPTRTIELDGPLDLARTLFPLRRGTGDPVLRVDGRVAWRASRNSDGPATVRFEQRGHALVVAEAWGAGADAALERAPGVIGALDDASGFVPRHRAVIDAWRRHRGVRLTRTGELLPALVAAICEQKVTGVRARRAWRTLVRMTSEPAPGDAGLWLPPDPVRLAALPSFAFHQAELERRRADVVRGICERASRIERLAEGSLADAKATLGAFPGIGPWTVAEVARLALGDADAVSVGDFHLPNLVAWALAGEPRASDERMLELLEPYRGHRGRVQRLLETGGNRAPSFGPRADVGSIAGR